MAQRQLTAASDGWSDADQGMFITCRMIADVLAGRLPPNRTPTYFRLGPGVVAFLSGPSQVLELRSNGDGSYYRNTTVMAGTGGVGLALLAGSLAGSAIGNSRARARAMADAQVAFRHQFDAVMYVTNAGMIFQNAGGVFTWWWSDVQAMQVVGPHDVLMQGKSDRGPVTWRLLTPWAELVMVLWALDQHPQHPQLQDGSWIAGGWLDRCRAFGRDHGLASPRIVVPPSHPGSVGSW